MGLSERMASNRRRGEWEGNFSLEHLYTVGVAGERALRVLKDDGELVGTRCSACGVVYAPARLYCERCLRRLSEWVPVALRGSLESSTIVHRGIDGDYLQTLITVGLIHLEGSNGSSCTT